MQTGKFNVLVDGQWGSTGKGLISTFLAWKRRPQILTSTNAANAGHTTVWTDGRKFIGKVLPTPAILHAWCEDYDPTVMLGPTAAFHVDRLLAEWAECGRPRTAVHPRAGVITAAHREREAARGSSTQLIASTMQGCGAFLADKVMRRADLRLALDYDELRGLLEPAHQAERLIAELTAGATALHEGSQGFSLDISHGSHWPFCTSRSTTAAQAQADMGTPARLLGDVYLVLRPYPIRVGNVTEGDQTLGHSGGCYDDHCETSWEAVATAAGAPREAISEYTTVTGRLRRVFTYSPRQVKLAAAVNGATRIALNFVNYVDWSCYGADDPTRLSQKVMDFIRRVEDDAQTPVTLVGTGPQVNHVIEL